MQTINGLPVYQALIEGDNLGMKRMSLVDDPAVMSLFQTFAEDKPLRFAVEDEDKHLVWGCVMRADFPIYRRDRSGEYYIIYTADTIRQMAERYLAEGRQNKVDIMHDGKEVEGVEMVQLCIQDRERGIVPSGFEGIADGSLFAEYHITNEEVWAMVKDGTCRGFSLEGLFAMEPCEKEISNKQNMGKLKTFFAALTQILAQFGRVATDKGILVWDGDGDLSAGDQVYTESEGGERTAAADGEYITEDGKTIVVTDGRVAEIRDNEAEVAPEGEVQGEDAAPESNDHEERIAALEDAIARITEMLGIVLSAQKDIKAELAKPAAAPAEEEFKKIEKGEAQPIDRRCRKALRFE